ncbi:MAG: DUF1445 domain-containing protein [Hydrogenophaga sp.]|jgi:uncharacterized protein YcsI (UPF0317 family)|nr:DUF1445 domain-containing protein [Hydrogenophaga sp.]
MSHRDHRNMPRPLAELGPAELRAAIRQGYQGTTSGLARGHVQCNLVVLPAAHAAGFVDFCRANPAALPLVGVGQPGNPHFPELAIGGDIRSDLGGYIRVARGQPPASLSDLRAHWSADAVAVLLGCWFTAESVLAAEGIRLRHMEQGIQGGLFRTRRACVRAGGFEGPLVVSMRPFLDKDVPKVVALTRPLHLAHGEPIHQGHPAELGIQDLGRPDWGEPLPPEPGEVPLYWGCGLTANEALARADLPWFVTHQPGRMWVTDLKA